MKELDIGEWFSLSVNGRETSLAVIVKRLDAQDAQARQARQDAQDAQDKSNNLVEYTRQGIDDNSERELVPSTINTRQQYRAQQLFAQLFHLLDD